MSKGFPGLSRRPESREGGGVSGSRRTAASGSQSDFTPGQNTQTRASPGRIQLRGRRLIVLIKRNNKMTLSTQAAVDRLLIGGAAANPVLALHSIKFGTLFFQNPLREGPPLAAEPLQSRFQYTETV